MGKTDFHRRLLCIDKEIVGPRNAKMQQGMLDRASQAFSVRSKPFWDLTAAQKVGLLGCGRVGYTSPSHCCYAYVCVSVLMHIYIHVCVSVVVGGCQCCCVYVCQCCYVCVSFVICECCLCT